VTVSAAEPVSLEAHSNLLFNFRTSPFVGVTVTGGTQVTGKAPQFKNQKLEVKSSSPAIDAGSCTHAPPEDFQGTKRPQGGGCDVGAHEQ
jgi:hypothetical protein